MIESLMIDSIWEEVLPLACLGLRWLGPPFEQLIEGEHFGMAYSFEHYSCDTSCVTTIFRVVHLLIRY